MRARAINRNVVREKQKLLRKRACNVRPPTRLRHVAYGLWHGLPEYGIWHTKYMAGPARPGQDSATIANNACGINSDAALIFRVWTCILRVVINMA